MMSKLSVGSRWWFVVVVSVVVGTGVVLFCVFQRTPEPPPIVVEENSVNPAPTSPLVEPAISPEVDEPTPVWYGPVTIADLLVECPEPFGREKLLSEKCISMLEPFFIDLPYIPVNGFQWLHFPQRLTYRRIFAHPAQDRELVLEALQRSECRFEDGGDKGIRAELRESCHAESFYVTASFAATCLNFIGSSRSLIHDYDLDPFDDFDSSPNTAVRWEEHLTELATDSNGRFHQTQYARLKEDVWHTKLEAEWHGLKCREYDRNSMKIDWEDRDSEYRDLLESMLNQLTDDPSGGRKTSYRRHEHYFALNVIAAHLGDFSASLLYASFYQYPVGYYVSSSLIRQIHKQHPWMSRFEGARNLKYWSPSLDKERIDNDFANFVEKSVKGLLKLDELGVEYDKEAFVDRICRRYPDSMIERLPKKPSCKRAIERMSAWNDVSFDEGLKLEEIRSIASQLGIWE